MANSRAGSLPLVRGREDCYENLPPLLRGGVRLKADGGVMFRVLQIAIIEADTGMHFDPLLAPVFINLVREEVKE